MSTVSTISEKQRAAATTAKNRSLSSIFCEFVLCCLIAIVVLEVTFRACGVGGQEFLEPDPVLGCRQIPGKQVTWRLEGYSNDRLSFSGRRDVEHAIAKAPGVTRIAVLGDSATEGLQVSLGQTYCRLLEQMLNSSGKNKVEVMNFGCSSYSTGQQVIQFEREVEAYKPDITVLLYVRGAALQNTYNPFKRAAEPRPYFYLDRKGALQEDDSILREQAKALQPNAVLSFLRNHSRIYGVFDQANLSLSIHEPLYNKIKGWITSLCTKLQPGQHDFKSGRLLYAPQDVLPVTEALLTRLNQDCQRVGSKLVLVIFPNTVNDPVLAQQIPELTKLSQQNHFWLLDLTPSFKANPDPNSLFLLYHFSAAGHKLTAQELAKYLPKEILVNRQQKNLW